MHSALYRGKYPPTTVSISRGTLTTGIIEELRRHFLIFPFFFSYLRKAESNCKTPHLEERTFVYPLAFVI